ncbi:MAG: hypothetical protein JXR50_02670, partial [Prolixibacteraceae bacterium]|nr:hypothetical protein [Prolixibacteraceae bacterium]
MKTALLQAEALACELGLANVLFCALAVHFSFFFKLVGNGWYMLSGRISESVPVRRTRNCETRIR